MKYSRHLLALDVSTSSIRAHTVNKLLFNKNVSIPRKRDCTCQEARECIPVYLSQEMPWWRGSLGEQVVEPLEMMMCVM